jgi:peptidyl-prolyl cis-trans isomerase D
MLQAMRENVKSLKIFLWLVIAAFIGTIFFVWGQGSGQGRTRSQNAVALVNGTPISYASFESSFRNVYGFYKQVYGDNLTPEMMKNLQLEQVALNQLTQNTLLAQEAERYKLSVSDDELVQAIHDMSQFQTDGKFDPALYRSTLERARLKTQDFEDQVEESLLVNKIKHIIQQSARVSDQEVLNDYQAQNETVQVEGLLVKAEDFKEGVEFTDEELQSYYDAHKEEFTAPPRIKIQYIQYDPQVLKAEITPAEEDIRDYYDANESEFNKGKEVKASHILLRTASDADEDTLAGVKAKAEGLLAQLQEGAVFAELAKEYSEDPGSAPQGGELGFFTKGRMVPEFEEAAFALAPGEISDLVKTQFGYHIIKVEEIREEADPYAKAKEEITERLKLAGAKELAAERAEFGYEDLLDLDNLEEVAAKDGLEVKVSDFFAQGEPIDSNTNALPQLQQVAFTLNSEQKFSQPIETPEGYYLIEFLELKEPYVPELAEVTEDVSEALRQEKAEGLAKAEIENIRQALTDGTPWESLAEQEHVETITPRPFSRRQTYIAEARGNAEEFTKTAFALSGDNPSEILELSSDYCIIRVTERQGIDPDAFETEKDALKERLLQQKQSTVLRDYIDELQQNAEIRYVEGLFSS